MKASHPFSPVRTFIRKELRRRVAPGLAVAVAQDGKILWEDGFGWADWERGIPASPHTLWSLASITKPITATALMRLVEAGKIDLDKPIDGYLPGAGVRARVGSSRDATVRRVASHTAGLPLHFQFFYADEPYQRPPMETTILRYANLVTAPGERFRYSNLGYGLLDTIIAHVSGKSYAQFVLDEVFRPLGMNRSSIDIAPELGAYAAARYGEDRVPYPFYDFDHPGGSAAYCSAHDLIRFGMFHLKEHLQDQEPILSDESLDEMQKTTPMIEGSAHYGVGWSVEEDPRGFLSISHEGGMGGVRTVLSLIPQRRIAIVVLCNQACELPAEVRSRILNLMLPETAAAPAEEEAPPSEQDSTEPAIDVSGVQGAWSGSIHTYNGDLPFVIRIDPTGEVTAQIRNGPPVPIESLSCQNGCLTGIFDGSIETEDTDRYPYRLHLDLRLRDEVLNGGITAQTHQDGPYGGASGKRPGSALASWVQLSR